MVLETEGMVLETLESCSFRGLEKAAMGEAGGFRGCRAALDGRDRGRKVPGG